MMRIEIPTIKERAGSLERRLVERLPILGRDDERLALEIELSAHLGPDVDGSLAERLVRTRFESQAKPRRFERGFVPSIAWPSAIARHHATSGAAVEKKGPYSGRVWPEPPISFGTSFIFGSPSFTERTDSW